MIIRTELFPALGTLLSTAESRHPRPLTYGEGGFRTLAALEIRHAAGFRTIRFSNNI